MGIHLSHLQHCPQSFSVSFPHGVSQGKPNLEPRVILASCQRHEITFDVHASFVREYRKIPNDGVVASFLFIFFVK